MHCQALWHLQLHLPILTKYIQTTIHINNIKYICADETLPTYQYRSNNP